MHKTQKSIVKSLFDESFLLIKRSSRGSDCYSALRQRSPAAAPAWEMCRPVHFPETCFLSRQRPLPPPRHPVSSLSSADELIAFFLCILWRCPTAYSGNLRVSERARPPQARHGSGRGGRQGRAGQGRREAGREDGEPPPPRRPEPPRSPRAAPARGGRRRAGGGRGGTVRAARFQPHYVNKWRGCSQPSQRGLCNFARVPASLKPLVSPPPPSLAPDTSAGRRTMRG